MKKVLITFMAVTFVLGQSITAQADKKKEAEKAENKKGLTYLTIQQHRLKAEELVERNLYRLRVLEIIVHNFGSDKKSVMKELKEEYVKGKALFYQQQYTPSFKTLTTSEEKINSMFSEFSGVYKGQVEEILKRCAFALTEVELNEITNEPGTDIYLTNKSVVRNKHRLKIAYEDLRIGKKMMREDRHYDAIKHFRSSKNYGIKILADLADGKDGKNKILTEFKTHLVDNANVMADK